VATHEFEATLERPGAAGTWTFLRVPFDVREAFGSRARMAVRGSVNGIAIRSSLMPQGDGAHILVVNKSVRAQAGAEAGDTVLVALDRDVAPRAVDVPPDLGNALLEGGVTTAFEAMSYSHQKEYVDWSESAKRTDTRVRRIERAGTMITDGRRLKS
jgi:hypothetical protein